MMKRRKFLLNRYYRQIRRQLSCTPERKRRIIEDIRSGVESFLEENPDADMAAVTARFGTPEQITEGYLNEMDTKEIQKQLRVRGKVIRAVAVAVVAALLMWGTAIVIALVNEFITADYHIVAEEINILEDGETIPPMEVE